MGWPWSPSGPALRAPWVPGAVSQDLVDEGQRRVREHGTYSRELLELQQWVAAVTQKLQSHQRDTGPWDAQSQEAELEVRQTLQRPCIPQSRLEGPEPPPWGAEAPSPDLTGVLCPLQRLLADLPEKEARLPLVEAHGRLVMEKSSLDGAAVVQEELRELVEAWGALRRLEEGLLR